MVKRMLPVRYYSPQHVASLLGRSAKTVVRWGETGQLPGLVELTRGTRKRSWGFRKADLDAYLAAMDAEAGLLPLSSRSVTRA